MQQSESQQKIVMDKLDYLEKRRLKIVRTYPELKQEFDYHYLSMLVILSRDAAATKESIKTTRYMLKQYFSKDEKCKIDFALRRQLFALRHRSVEKILQKHQDMVYMKEEHQYFE